VYKILKKRTLGPKIREYVIEAPEVARVAQAGQFIVLRLHEKGERIPLTIVECDEGSGGVTVVVQEVGKSTLEMGDCYGEGDFILDFVGPLGRPTEVSRYGTVIGVGGGLGIAPLLPIVRAHLMAEACDELHVVTDDGSYGSKGFVSDPLREILSSGRKVDRVWAIGPAVMMKACVGVTKGFDVTTIVSLNSIMIDGTGMCGGCRVEVGGKAKFACVDGPEFDGFAVDFDLLIARQRFYAEEEACALERYLASRKEGGEE